MEFPYTNLLPSVEDLIGDHGALTWGTELRSQVLALCASLDIHTNLPDNLKSTVNPSTARRRILNYFLAYPHIHISPRELLVISGSPQFFRRTNELIRRFGWWILRGDTILMMANEDDYKLETDIKQDSFVLISTEQDRDATYRWNVARDLRKRKDPLSEKLLVYLRKNAGRQVTGEELRYVARDRTEWARRVRELRTEEGWPVKTKNSGRPDLPLGAYILEQDRQSEPHDRHIRDSVRVQVLERDDYRCRKCDWGYNQQNPADPRNMLELHHIEHHARKGANEPENLVTLCNVHHDEVHSNDDGWGASDFFDWLNDGT